MKAKDISRRFDARRVSLLLRQKALESGTQEKFAQAHGLSLAYVRAVVQGKDIPGIGVLTALGLIEIRITKLGRSFIQEAPSGTRELVDGSDT